MAVHEEGPGPSTSPRRGSASVAHPTSASSADTNGVPPEAGPSRHRSQRSDSASAGVSGSSVKAGSSPVTAEALLESLPHLDLATYPTPQLLRLLARLLQQIASSNDQLRAEHTGDETGSGSASDTGGDAALEPPPNDGASSAASAATSHSRSSTVTHDSPTAELFHDDPPIFDLASGDKLFTASKASLSQPQSILSFHARHVPSISIEAYLLRILKYCPTTNEVFLGLLVYFDRMSKLGTSGGVGGINAAVGPRGFAIDSYNIHRLIIAGVTVASKFFSDVFYTNSRYAKVGGLPPHELNQLELQFLLLNNFTLMIPSEEMQRYGDRLLAYWHGREEEAGVTPEAANELRRQERERERDRQREREQRAERERRRTSTSGDSERERQRPASAAAASTSGGMDVDGAPPSVSSSTSSATVTGPPSTSAPSPGSTPQGANGSSGLSRSSSLPRRNPSSGSGDAAPPTSASSSRNRPAVSFAPAPGLRDSAVGVGP